MEDHGTAADWEARDRKRGRRRWKAAGGGEREAAGEMGRRGEEHRERGERPKGEHSDANERRKWTIVRVCNTARLFLYF